jgi:hypothetical protein
VLLVLALSLNDLVLDLVSDNVAVRFTDYVCNVYENTRFDQLLKLSLSLLECHLFLVNDLVDAMIINLLTLDNFTLNLSGVVLHFSNVLFVGALFQDNVCVKFSLNVRTELRVYLLMGS